MAKVTTKRTINASAEDVWASLDDYGGIAKWNENLAASRVLPGSVETGLGAKRQCDLKADGSEYLRETINVYEPGRKLGLVIDDTTMPMKGATCLFEVRPLGSNKSEITFSMQFKPPMGIIGQLMLPMMKPCCGAKWPRLLRAMPNMSRATHSPTRDASLAQLRLRQFHLVQCRPAGHGPNNGNADGVDGSCFNRRRNAPYCRCPYLLLGGATQCKLPQSASIWPRTFFKFTGLLRMMRSHSIGL